MMKFTHTLAAAVMANLIAAGIIWLVFKSGKVMHNGI